MPSLTKVFNFFNNQDRVDQLGSGVTGIAAAGGVATAIGVAAGMGSLGVVGLVVELGTIAVFTPLLFGAGEKFVPKAFAVSTALALAGIFGISAALPLPSTTPASRTNISKQTLIAKEPAPLAATSRHDEAIILLGTGHKAAPATALASSPLLPATSLNNRGKSQTSKKKNLIVEGADRAPTQLTLERIVRSTLVMHLSSLRKSILS